jgi:hypothetical protein
MITDPRGGGVVRQGTACSDVLVLPAVALLCCLPRPTLDVTPVAVLLQQVEPYMQLPVLTFENPSPCQHIFITCASNSSYY